MARAKRTARAEARRRYRVEHPPAETELDDATEATATDDAPAAGRPVGGGRPVGSRDAGRPARRPGLLGSFRQAYEPADIRADLRALPQLLRSRAIYLTAILVIVSTVVYIAAAATIDASTLETGLPSASAQASAAPAVTPSPDASAAANASPSPSGAAGGTAPTGATSLLATVASILALLFLQTPPFGGIYLAAILAKRASYLAGGIAGLFGALGFSVYVLTLQIPASVVPNLDELKTQVIEQALLTSTIFGILIGAGLGYYRRLLRLMSPAPAGRSGGGNRSKPAGRR